VFFKYRFQSVEKFFNSLEEFSLVPVDNKIFNSKGVEVKGVNLTNFKEDFNSKISNSVKTVKFEGL
ncbi:hypothetical protein RLC89_05140, partial [Streptococcus pneumoniae]|nr:hypothetical protein [Streptococcus pneumoniae]MDS2573328.1 hypothetical protein [Streptococcus pneumoniae]MDS2652901.1 hypothetical protein [Streptococcus pneumoniae]MDS2763614.1 hypothetical protein [Streptococcus pneumoniae]MDS3356170.1 hypothetical protein [Streptococcus pneumoniae]